MTENDEPFLEGLLKSVPLREPSYRLDARVESVFANHRAYAPRRLWLNPAIVGRMVIAAGVLIAMGIGVRLSLPKHSQPMAITTAPSELVAISHPIRFEQETSTVIDDGIIASTDDAAVYQQYRRRTVREIFYEDPATHAKLQVTIPTEQIVIRKVEAY